MISLSRHGAFMRMFSSALASQAVLSGASFLVGVLLIRRTSDLQYGYYILVSGAILLAASLQYSFIGPSMVNRMTRSSPAECGDLTGGLYRGQQKVIAGLSGIALLITLALWTMHWLDAPSVLLMLATIATIVAALRREYFRMVLLAYRRSHIVLRGDVVYSLLLGIGVLLATYSPLPAAAAVLAMGLASLISGSQLSRDLRRVEAWNLRGAPGILRDIARLGAWSTAGAGIHWSFSQGYTYLVAGTLDIRTVGAIAATRLLAMPVNLLSTGVGSLMLPLTSRWLHQSGAPLVLRRLLLFSLVIAAISIFYFSTLWILRDWLFDVVLKKQFAQRDHLLMLWSAIFVVMAVRQQLLYLLVARERFHLLTPLALISAVLSLSCSYWGMLQFGGVGAPLGILVGEVINTIGVVILCVRETTPEHAMSGQQAAAVS